MSKNPTKSKNLNTAKIYNTAEDGPNVLENGWVIPGDLGAPAVPSLRFKGYRDQEGRPWIKAKSDIGTYWFHQTLPTSSTNVFINELSRLGFAALSGATRTRLFKFIEGIVCSSPCFSISKPGYCTLPNGIVIYITPGHHIIKPPGKKLGTALAIDFQKNPKSHTKGNFEQFVERLVPLVRKQSLPLLALGFSLAPLLLPFPKKKYHVENSFLEFVGPTTTSKSVLVTALAGSVWGGSHDKTRYAGSWNATDNDIEDDFPLRNDSLNGLDETTNSGKSQKLRAETVSSIVHRFSNGKGKERMYHKEPLSFRSLAMSTSNRSLALMMDDGMDESDEVKDSVDVRIVSVLVDQALYDLMFDFVPKGFNTAMDAAAEFHAIAEDTYGHLAPAFALAVLKEVKKDAQRFRERIEKLMHRFMIANGIAADPAAFRTAKCVSLGYAALVLAKSWKLIPGLGEVLPYMTKAYATTRTKTGSQSDPIQPILAFARRHLDRHIEVGAHDKPILTDVEFAKVPYFIYRGGDRMAHMVITSHQITGIPNWQQLLKRLRRERRLIFDKNLQTKVTLRRINAIELHDQEWCYRIILPSWPL